MNDTREILTFAVELGDKMLRNGAEVYRVEDTVLHILSSFDITDCDVYVLSNGIFASANEGRDDACSVVRHVPLGSNHLGRVAAMNQLSRRLCAHELTLEEAWEELKAADSIPFSSFWAKVFFCGLGSGCFSYIFGGTVLDSVIAFFVGLLLQLFLELLGKHKTSRFMTNILGSALVTALSLLVVLSGMSVHYDKIIIGDIMPLVPGIALTTGVRDFFNGDYLSGAIHMLDALLTSLCIAAGVGTIITLYLLVPGFRL